jgi:GWxTD domain-containing protein
MTAEERKQWESVLTQADAEKFIDEYWKKYGDAFHNEVKARIAAADKYFSMQDRKGSETEKGRVFMILGSPDKQTNSRSSFNRGGFGAGPSGSSSIEQSAITSTEWYYQRKLSKDYGIPELTVKFQTDVSRGFDTIENPGLVEPALKRVVELNMAKLAAGNVPIVKGTAPDAKPAPVGVSPELWTVTPNLQGAYFTGEPFISPTEKSFYAYSFYLPQSVASLAGAKDVVLVGSIKDANGNQVATFRQPATPSSYDAGGDRYADGAVELGPGKYNGVFALYSADGNTLLASSKTDFDVPTTDLARVSRTFLTSHIDTLDKQGAFDPWTFIAMKYAVKGNATFRASDSIGWFTYIANPAANPNPSMTVKFKVSRDGKVIDSSPPMPADLQQTGPHTYLLATRFEPNTLRPGKYTLELTLRDTLAQKSYTNTAEFTVVQ